MSLSQTRWVPEVIDGGADAKPREALAGTLIALPPAQRAMEAGQRADDILNCRVKAADIDGLLEEVHALRRVTLGLVSLAKARGVSMADPVIVEPEADPMGVLLATADFCGILQTYFRQPQPYLELALAFAALPFPHRLQAADKWAEEALAFNFRLVGDPLADIYALQLIARSCALARRFSRKAPIVAEWVFADTDPLGALQQAAGVLAMLARDEGLTAISSDMPNHSDNSDRDAQ
jgi:hypothetical protein